MDIVNINVPIIKLFRPVSNGLFEYIYKNTLKIGNIKIIPGQHLDLSEIGLLSAFKDKATLNLHLVDNVLHYKSHTLSF